MRLKKKPLFILAILLIGVVMVLWLAFSPQVPPVATIALARHHIREAKLNQAGLYASASYRQAEIQYDSAMNQWKEENEKLFFLRNYDQAEKHAKTASQWAVTSLRESKQTNKTLRQKIQEGISQAEKMVTRYERTYGNLPMAPARRTEWSTANTLLREGKIAYENDNYPIAHKKIEKAIIGLSNTLNHTESYLSGYLQAVPEWQQWAGQAIERSKHRRSTCLVIDKYARQCYVYRNGKRTGQFEAELGSNWIGDKNYRGDKATPEGSYKVLRKKAHPETKYYKALLINYPNEDDIRRFEKNKKDGTIGKNASIGNLIEIHGDGGKGIDWTDGCIALTNDDMDDVYAACATGTEIIIVGSLRSFDDITK